MKDLESDDRIKKWITPLATFRGSGYAEHKQTMHNITEQPYRKDLEFVAIAEGIDLPIYLFTYNIEMTQFSFTDMLKNPDQVECIDKSLLSRHHAQFISHQIADEARLNNHKLELSDQDFSRLMRHHQVVTIEYSFDTNENEHDKPLPKGLEQHDVYLVKQTKKELQNPVSIEDIED